MVFGNIILKYLSASWSSGLDTCTLTVRGFAMTVVGQISRKKTLVKAVKLLKL